MYELYQEKDGKFIPTGRMIPEDEDPHTYVSTLQKQDGVAYSAHQVVSRHKGRWLKVFLSDNLQFIIGALSGGSVITIIFELIKWL